MSFHDVHVTIPLGDIPTELSNYGISVSNALIINNFTQKVWISDDSSLRSGTGTPLNGFTSMRWSRTGRVWAVLDSAETQQTEIILSHETSEYQPSPVDVALAINAKGIPITAKTDVLLDTVLDYSAFDVPSIPAEIIYPGVVGLYTSMLMNIVALSAEAVADSSFWFFFQWYNIDSTGLETGTASQTIEVFDQFDHDDGESVTQFQIVTPVLGDHVYINAHRQVGTGGGSVSVTIAATTRELTKSFTVSGSGNSGVMSPPNADAIVTTGDDNILLYVQGTLDADEVIEFPLVPWNGRCTMKLLAGLGSGNVVFDVLVGRGFSTMGWHYIKVVGSAETLDELLLPNRQCRLRIHNQGLVTNSFFALIVGEGRT